MPQNFPPSLNILTYVATVLGADDSIQAINTDKLPGRAIIACEANNSLYMFRKESTAAPSGSEIVMPANGVGRWIIYPADTGASDPLHQIRYVDGSAAAGGNGSEGAPFTTLQAAINDLPTGGIMLIAPGTYPDPVNIPGIGVNYTFTAIGFAGLVQVLVTGLITWHIVNGSQVSWSGIRMVNGATGGPVFTEDNTGTGAVRWNLTNCVQGVQTHDATARTHDVRIRAASLPVNGLDSLEPTAIPTRLMGFDVSGQVQVAGGTLNGPGPFNCSLIRTRGWSSITAGITINLSAAGSSIEATGFATGGAITLATSISGVVNFDPQSFASWALSGSVITGGSLPFVFDVYMLEKIDGPSGAAKTIDFGAHVNHVVAIDANTLLTLIPPSQAGTECTLRLLGTTGRVITFSPTLKASGGALAPFVGDCWLRLLWTGTSGWWAENIPNIL